MLFRSHDLRVIYIVEKKVDYNSQDVDVGRQYCYHCNTVCLYNTVSTVILYVSTILRFFPITLAIAGGQIMQPRLEFMMFHHIHIRHNVPKMRYTGSDSNVIYHLSTSKIQTRQRRIFFSPYRPG